MKSQNNNIVFRLAKLDDLKILVDINIDKEESYRRINEKMFSKIIPEERVLICEKDKEIIGLLYWQKHFWGRTDIYYLEQITINKEYRKSGYGLELVQQFIKHCKQKKVKKI